MDKEYENRIRKTRRMPRGEHTPGLIKNKTQENPKMENTWP